MSQGGFVIGTAQVREWAQGCPSDQCNASSKKLGEDAQVGELPQQLAVLPAGFPFDFLEKLAWKITNGTHVIIGHFGTSYKYECIAKHSDHNHVTKGVLEWSNFENQLYNYHSFSAVKTLNGH